MEKVKNKLNKTIDFIYTHRYLLSICIFIICVLFKISGSSIGCWNYLIPNKDGTNLTIGANRSVRSDEWATLTPMFFSQVANGFHYFNTSLRGTSTDVFIVYALPVLTIFQLFRPFLIGFILFGAERGLSFFWCGRIIALFLVSLDFFMILTKKNKPLSFIGALMITLAPITQWWFAVNGIAELFIFGELIIIMIYKYLNTNNFKKRLFYLFITYVSAGGYALVFYPSWQIPLFYVFAALGIGIIIENYKNSKIKLKDVISIIGTVLLLGISLFLIINKSIDTIKIISNTDYPGKRFETGGGQISFVFSYIINLFLPLKQSGLVTNASEEAMMFTLFPIGLLLSIKSLFGKNKDKINICLLIVYLLLGIYCIIGFPNILAKYTFLSNSQAHRTLIGLGLIDVILLIRGLANKKEPFKIKYAILYTILLTTIFIFKVSVTHKVYLNIIMIVCLTIMCLYLFYTALRYHTKYGKYLFAIGITFVLLVSGGLVNPIRFGSSDVLNNELLKQVKQIDSKDQGLWIAEGVGYPLSNYIAISGVKTINVTNTYPDLDKWNKIDKDKKYKTIYNRYAHIQMEINDNKEKFELLNPDVFKVNVTNKDLDVLKVKYIFTSNNLEEKNDENHVFKKLYQQDNYKIYKVIRG